MVYLQAMEIASERTAEERSNQDKVDEEVHLFLTILNFCFSILTSRVSIVMGKKVLNFQYVICRPVKLIEMAENVKFHVKCEVFLL